MLTPRQLFNTTLISVILASPILSAHAAGPETANDIRKRRAERQLEENRKNQERQAQDIEPADLPEIDPALVKEFTQRLSVIADPSMEGRIPGSHGIEKASEYIESRLVELGLTPAFEDESGNPTFRQPMQMGTQTSAVSSSIIAGDHSFIPNEDFSPLAYSGSQTVTAPAVFAGYGIVSGPNSYLGFETNETVEDKVAIVLNYEPMDENGHSLWNEKDGWSHNARLTYKVTALQRRGAAAVIIVSPPDAQDSRVDILETIESTSPPSNRMGKRSGPEYDIPVVHATPQSVETILTYLGSDESLAQLIQEANTAGIVKPLGEKEITIGVELERTPRMTWNLGAILPGQGTLKDEFVVVGSHYDHVGYGKFGSRTPNRRGEVHPGADDNGTGTTANMITAELLENRYQLLDETQSARSILFLWFTAEESGLNGSKFYVEHPIAPLENHDIMLNMDMVGTLSDGLLEIGGFNTGEGFKDLADPSLKQSVIPYSEDVSVGSGRSDHASFSNAGVPALFFFTGLHERYHTPDDSIEFIDNEGCVRVAMLVSSIGYDAATQQQRIIHPMSRQKDEADEGPKVRVGIIPSNSAKGGMRIERVFEDTSASQAGLMPGDRITKWNDAEIDSVEAWMPILSKHQPGDVVKLQVQRGDETLELEMTLRPIE